MLALILVAGFVEVGIEEFARDIDNPFDRTADRRAVDVHIEHAHENRNPGHRLFTQCLRSAQFGRWRHNLDQRDQAVGGCHNKTIVSRRGTRGIAKERQRPCGYAEHRPSQRFPGHDCE